jgi:hypothetical protein
MQIQPISGKSKLEEYLNTKNIRNYFIIIYLMLL